MKLRLIEVRAYLLKTFCLLALTITAAELSAQMRQVYVDNRDYNEIRKLSFLSPAIGYAGFNDWVGYTTDSGRTFAKKTISYGNVNFNGYFNVNLTFGFYIAGVHAVNQNTVIVYGDYGACPSILYSTDQGNTFTLIYHTPFNPNLSYWDKVGDMVFPGNGSVGFAVTGDRILRSTNAGKTWSAVASTPGAEWQGIEAPDANTIYTFTTESANYSMLKSVNGGGTWQPVTFPSAGSVKSASFLTPARGWILFYPDNGNGTGIYYTSNGGSSWTRKDFADRYVDKIKFINDSVGYGIGYFFDTYKTTDSGKIWERLPRDNNFTHLGFHHNDIHFWNNTQFWCGGYYGFLELTTNGGGLPFPKAYFNIDTAGLSVTGTVNLINRSKTTHQFKWYKNDTLLTNGYHASYNHNINQAIDTIKLIALNATGNDTLVQYQYFNLPPPPPVPTLTSFTPATGFPGTIVTINGTNLNGATAVTIGGVPAASFTVASSTRITAVVGAGASGSISVTTPYGTVSLAGFTFQTQTVISSFVPHAGPAGSSVVIKGSNFSAVAVNNIVRFGGVAATVTAATATQLTVTVPAGAGYEPISVTVNGATAYTGVPFVLTFPDGGPVTSGIYPDKIKIATDVSPNRIETSDIDGDGKLDIITGAVEQPRLAVLRNTSTGDAITFANPVYATYGAGVQITRPFSIADINGDGKPDLLPANPGAGITAMVNNSVPGNISFTNSAVTPAGLGAVNDLQVADFDGDGKPDIYTYSSSGLRVLRNTGNTGTISFTLLPALNVQGSNFSKARVTDVDGDGKTDICINSLSAGVRKLIVLKNTSNGSNIGFTPLYFNSNLACEKDLYTGDLDMDGKPEVAMVDNVANKLTVMHNSSTAGIPSFAAPQTFNILPGVLGLRIADLNGDGKPDIGLAMNISPQTSAPDNELSVFENTSVPGTISLAARADVMINNTNGGRELVLGDWNNDNRPDAATVWDSLTVFVNRAGTLILQICDGADSSLTANITGSAYQWQENSGSGFVNISDNSNFSGTNTQTLQLHNIPASWNGRRYRCLVNGSSSYLYELRVKAFIVPQVTIIKPAELCQPALWGFGATVVNGGTKPLFRWELNGINVVHGANVTNDNDSLLVIQARHGDILKVIVTSNATCISGEGIDVDTLKVEQYTTPAVILSSSHSSVCNGQPVTFTATAINAGTKPQYSWMDNGVPLPMKDTNVITVTNPNAYIMATVKVSSGCHQGPTVINSNIIQLKPTPANPTVSVSATANGPCGPTPTAFVASYVNGGDNPSFQWQVNGVNVGTNSNVYMRSTPGSTDKVQVTMTSNSACAPTTTATSTPISTIIPAAIVPAITISSTGNTCQGGSLQFSATVSNTGQHPSYQWQVNGVNVGTNSTTFNANSLVSGDKVRAVLFSSEVCATPGMVYSNEITIGNINLPPSVVISTPNNNVCAGAGVTFTAVAANAGSSPVYQWKKNGVNIGTNSDTYADNALANGDVITVSFTSNTGCAGGTPVTVNSNAITMNVTQGVAPSISIAASGNTICSGDNVTFTATPVNGGTAPMYQWQVNGVNSGANSNVFSTTSLTNGSVVRVLMTSNAACAAPVTATSNAVTIAVNNAVTPAITISTPTNTVCAGSNVTFTAAVTNAGTNPVYQWKKNGVNEGSNSNTFTVSSLASGDVITASLTSNVPCSASPVTVASNAITITVTASLTPAVSIATPASTICAGQSVTFTATPVNGGSTPQYQWQVNGVNAGTNANTFTTNGLANGAVVRVVLTSNADCLAATTANSNNITMTVNAVQAPTITISGNTSVVTGTTTQLAATITNGGANPLYQWQDSTFTHQWQNISGATAAALDYAPAASGDKIRCVLTSNAGCASPSTVTSAAMMFSMSPNGRVPNGPFGVLYYPNPATSTLTLDSLRLEDKWESIEITALSGESKMSVRNVQNQTRITIYIGGLPTGMYFAVLRRKNGAPGYYQFFKR